MSTHKYIDRLCAAAGAVSLLLTLLFMNGAALGLQAGSRTMGYEDRIFDTARVHTLDIVMDNWDSFLDTCENEEYSACAVIIDGEAYQNVGLRAKGNTSLSSVSQMGSDRYSFKVEFDHYDAGKSYYGLDKLVLNNLIQDNTMLKDYLTYRLMGSFGVDSPLCSFVWLTVNGEDWGLYLAVEGVEDAFLQRNYGSEAGELYKPDSTNSEGGGRGNGRDFNAGQPEAGGREARTDQAGTQPDGQLAQTDRPQRGQMPGLEGEASPENFDPAALSGGQRPEGGGGPGGGMGSDDVKLSYIDDDPDSYPNIFDNAKTDLSQADQTRLIASLKGLSSYENLEAVLDTDEVLRYFVVHNFVVNGDSYTGSIIHNYYLYEQEGRLSMIPWDYNLAFGGFQNGSASAAVNEAIDDALSDRPMQAWIFSQESYTQQYHELYAQFLDTVDVETLIDEAQALIAPYVERDPTKFCTFEQFQAGVEALKTFCALREESVRGQLEGTIPSTSEGQRTDSAALVDTGTLNLTDMGSMGGGMGGFNRGETVGENSDEARPAFAPGDIQGGGFGGPGGGNFTAPGGQDQEKGGVSPFLLGVSALFLLGGLLFAFKFRR